MKIFRSYFIYSFMFSCLFLPWAKPAYSASTELISSAVDISQYGYDDGKFSISENGRFVAFSSIRSDLVANDINGWRDVFVYDRNTRTTELVSISNEGYQANYLCDYASISADGRFVAFVSLADNLVAGDTNSVLDIFVRDRQTGTTERVSISSSGDQLNDHSRFPQISSDGKFVVFSTFASNITYRNQNTPGWNIAIHDRTLHVTEVVSLNWGGGSVYGHCDYPYISGNNGFVAFSCNSSLVENDPAAGVFVRNLVNKTTRRVSYSGVRPSISFDGRYIADESGVFDATTGSTNPICVSTSGEIVPGCLVLAPSINSDGRYVTFMTEAILDPRDGTWQDVYVRDTISNTTEIVSLNMFDQGLGNSMYPSISGNGRYVAFVSSGDNAVPDSFTEHCSGSYCEYDMLVRDRGSVEIKHDGIDQDYNGYDLTIDINTATYKASQNRLTVNATSSLGAAANLALDGYGPMTYASNKWSIVVTPIGGKPATVTVSGVEGSETVPVQ